MAVSPSSRDDTEARRSLIADRDGGALAGGVGNGVADYGGAVAVFECCAVGRDGFVLGDALEQVRQLMNEGVLPAEDVAGRPPVLHERVLRIRNEHVGEGT